jgi:hypothetical protein
MADKHGNENPDSGYDHFHHFGRKSPHQGKVVEPIGDRRAPNSGPGGIGMGPKGMQPDMKPMPVQQNVPGGSESDID